MDPLMGKKVLAPPMNPQAMMPPQAAAPKAVAVPPQMPPTKAAQPMMPPKAAPTTQPTMPPKVAPITQPTAPSKMPSPRIQKPSMQKTPPDSYQQDMRAYIVGGLNLSVKGCIEGEAAVCTMLQKGCSTARASGSQNVSPEEVLLCQSVDTVCPQQLDGFEIAASICLQKTVHVCDAVPQICEALSAEDPSRGATCVKAFLAYCPQVRK